MWMFYLLVFFSVMALSRDKLLIFIEVDGLPSGVGRYDGRCELVSFFGIDRGPLPKWGAVVCMEGAVQQVRR